MKQPYHRQAHSKGSEANSWDGRVDDTLPGNFWVLKEALVMACLLRLSSICAGVIEIVTPIGPS